MHILYNGQLLQLARNLELEGVDALINVIEKAQSDIADKVAAHLGAQHMSTEWVDEEISTAFAPSTPGQECPEALVDYDEGSEWVLNPEDIKVPVPFIVLFRRSDDLGKEPPEAYRCIAGTPDDAAGMCSQKFGRRVRVLTVTQSTDVNVALARFYGLTPGEMKRATNTNVTPCIPFTNDVVEQEIRILDQEQGLADATGVLKIMPLGVSFRFNGHTDCNSIDDMGELVLVTKEGGDLYVTVFANVNQEDPTHRINLAGAGNLQREILRRATP